ncbi:Rieske 2Fe-2S domain-containing protein [Mycobacterium vicinigordonae]|uniref:Rieske-type oxygenase n=1 Tax=Mycobacterium vicinigordonae TaxID=1719132 RepID=A0A7D6DZU8_9MYCO|nr:Rieske 2Fe-2S domain-containing protein [Mycobacterium vicinigordonae]QLL08468.1 Rieske 2Fe-2S domain-containing protein [Mycobacterium vicinigordonae]
MLTAAKKSITAHPNSWYAVARSKDIPSGSRRVIHVLSREILLFRTNTGSLSAFDPFCPHLGAHIGKSGRVVDDTLQCGFHGWKFRADGSCAEIPYARRIPPKARLTSYPVYESHGLVFLYYHADRTAPSGVPSLPQLDAINPAISTWKTRRWHLRRLRSQLIDVNENVADPVHFQYVHGGQAVTRCELLDDEETFHTRVDFGLSFLGFNLTTVVDTILYEPGIFVNHTTYPSGQVLVVGGTTPIDEEHCQTLVKVLVPRSKSLHAFALSSIAAWRVGRAIGEDTEMFFSKVFRDHPLLCEEDRALARYRHWHSRYVSKKTDPPKEQSKIPAGAVVADSAV